MFCNEYYVVDMDRGCASFFTGSKYPEKRVRLEDLEPINYFESPPETGDPLTGPLMLGGSCYLISRSIFKAINSFENDGVQFLPVKVHVEEGETLDYFALNFYEERPWLDLSKSIYEDEDLTLHGIEKLVFDDELMAKVEEKDRLIFVLEACPNLLIFHKRVVDSIVEFYKNVYDDTVDGIKFTLVSEYQDLD